MQKANCMNKELYLFIIWQNARFMEKHIVNDIKKKFELFQVYEIAWSHEAFARNLARFYGKKLPKGCKKEKETGAGAFLVLLVYDHHPHIVDGQNLAIVSAKHGYRQMLGKNLVHASSNEQETNDDLLLLFGKSIKEIEQEQASFIAKPYKYDLVGHPVWNSLDEALNMVRKLPFTKVTMHKDSFLIHSRSADMVRRLLNAKSRFKLPGRHKYFIKIGKSHQPIYIRKVS